MFDFQEISERSTFLTKLGTLAKWHLILSPSLTLTMITIETLELVCKFHL